MSRFAARALALCVLFMVVGAQSARADAFVTPFVGYSFGAQASGCGNPATCEQRTSIGLSAGTSHGMFGFEEDISYIKEFFGKIPGRENAVLTVSSNMLFKFPVGPIEPYGVVGLAFIRPHATLDVAGMQMQRNTLGWDMGGGLTIRLQQHLGVRSDLRLIRTFKDMDLGLFSREQLEYWRGSVGLSLRF